MSTEIVVKSDVPVEVMPSGDLSKLQIAVQELESEERKLAQLGLEAQSYKRIETKEDAKKAGEILVKVRASKKVGGFKINPFLSIIDEIANTVRKYRTSHEEKCKAIDEPLARAIADYDEREKIAARAEEDRKNAERRAEANRLAEIERLDKERQIEADRKTQLKNIDSARKAGDLTAKGAEKLKKQTEAAAVEQKQVAATQAEQAASNVKTVKVVPDLPTVSGMRRTMRWLFKIVDITKVKRELLYPSKQDDGTYDPEDFPGIAKMVRETKDKAKAEAECPGIEVWNDNKV